MCFSYPKGKYFFNVISTYGLTFHKCGNIWMFLDIITGLMYFQSDLSSFGGHER